MESDSILVSWFNKLLNPSKWGNHLEDRDKRVEVEAILEKITSGLMADRQEINFLLSLTNQSEIELLFKAARKSRETNFGDEIFLYGFVYFSTYCRNNCIFCFYRSCNQASSRYRKTPAQVIETSVKLADSGVDLLDLTMGEDPYYFNSGNFEELVDLVASVKEKTVLPLMISPGLVPTSVIQGFSEVGVDWYACYQETHNRELFTKMRLNQDYDQRLKVKGYAHQLGMLAEEGLLVGVGETAGDLAYSFEVMDKIAADQVRVMSFIPQKGTPLENIQTGSSLRELLVIAVMRLLFPDRLIPASLDVDGIGGLKDRLNAGANVVTSIIPPEEGLMGVSQSTLDIDEGGRTVAGTIPILHDCGLQPAGKGNYSRWVENRKKRYITRNSKQEQEA
jgi:methylornithine synthase